MQKTIISQNINKNVSGYVVNTLLDEELRTKISTIQYWLKRKFGDAIWTAPSASLHITLLDWIAPLVDYEKQKDELFEELFIRYDNCFNRILKNIDTITVKFNEIKVTPNAIILIGNDNGEFNKIRKQFLDEIQLLPNTKLPPNIIHSTIARFAREEDIKQFDDFLSHENFLLKQEVTKFRLVRENVSPQLNHTLIKEYNLGSRV